MAGAGRVSDLAYEIKTLEAQLQDPDLDADKMTSVLERYGEVQLEFEQRGGYDLDTRAKEIWAKP
jgi:ATP-binding cassette subfamily F protein 3